MPTLTTSSLIMLSSEAMSATKNAAMSMTMSAPTNMPTAGNIAMAMSMGSSDGCKISVGVSDLNLHTSPSILKVFNHEYASCEK